MAQGTLTVQGIPWSYFKCEGKLAFGYGAHAIVTYDTLFLIKEKGEIVFVGFSMAECLEIASIFVWEYLAKQCVPSWEEGSHSKAAA